MRNMWLTVLCWLLCAPISSFAQRAPRKEPTPPPAAQVKQVVEKFNQAWASNDADGVRRACVEEVVVIESGRRIRDLHTVLEFLQINFKNFPKMEFQSGPIEPRIVGTTAWAHAETRMTLITPHNSKLNLVGYSSYVLERRREGWKIALVDFNLRQVQTDLAEDPPAAPPSVEGAWLLDTTKDVNTSQSKKQTAIMIFTKGQFCLFVAAPDRRQPKDKPLADYSKKELLELLRDVDPNAGTYRIEGNRIVLKPTLTLLPNQTGEELTLENVKVTGDRLSYEMMTPGGRLQRVWRRIE